MKTLTLLRHAKSDWDDPALDDFSRGLNARGAKAARAIGREMQRLGLVFDQVLASPAERVVQTLAHVRETYGDLAVRFDENLYLASVSTLLDLIQSAERDTGHLLLVGHNPGLESLVLRLTPGEATGLRGEVAEKFPTAALASLSFDVDDWKAVRAGSGRLEHFVRPRDLDPTLGPDPD